MTPSRSSTARAQSAIRAGSRHSGAGAPRANEIGAMSGAYPDAPSELDENRFRRRIRSYCYGYPQGVALCRPREISFFRL